MLGDFLIYSKSKLIGLLGSVASGFRISVVGTVFGTSSKMQESIHTVPDPARISPKLIFLLSFGISSTHA